METVVIQDPYIRAFNGVEEGLTYKEMSNETGIPEELLRLEHIKHTKESADYEQQIQIYAAGLIRKHGSKVLIIENINKIIQFIPYRFRSAVKHFIYKLKQQSEQKELDALS